MKKILKIVLIVLAVIILIAGVYCAYVFIDYYRLEDNLELEVRDPLSGTAVSGREYTIIAHNLGFGAYSDDYSFFMDGGVYSRAFSEQAVYENIGGALDEIKKRSPDLLLLQELDVDATRSYGIDQRELVYEELDGYCSVFAQNYDSPYLFYPITEPHGKSVAGIMTLSTLQIDSALRRSLPVESGFMKLLDLDRCYSVARIPTDNGKTLCVYNLHLSAYSSDGSIAVAQLQMLLAEMAAEYANGNYVVGGGDFNIDLLGNSPEIFDCVSGEIPVWAQPFPVDELPQGLSLIAPLDEENPVASSRCADAPYDPELAFLITLDGFIVSANVEVTSSAVIDEGYKFSDHNPVSMTFKLT